MRVLWWMVDRRFLSDANSNRQLAPCPLAASVQDASLAGHIPLSVACMSVRDWVQAAASWWYLNRAAGWWRPRLGSWSRDHAPFCIFFLACCMLVMSPFLTTSRNPVRCVGTRTREGRSSRCGLSGSHPSSNVRSSYHNTQIGNPGNTKSAA